jgi:shikimate dehydrogenase
MHNAALNAMGLNWAYLPFSVSPENVKDAVRSIRALGLVGVNVTVPLKQLVMPFLDEIDRDAQRIGSVNTIVNRDGRLIGYSTDGPGFLWDLESHWISLDGKRALVWGTGGSSRAVSSALVKAGAQVSIAGRSFEKAIEIARVAGQSAVGVDWNSAECEKAVCDADLLVNATPLGMAPKWENESPLSNESLLHPEQVVYDLVYVPQNTRLLASASKAGCEAIGGIGMLVRQGALSLWKWTQDYWTSSERVGEDPLERIVKAMMDSLDIS